MDPQKDCECSDELTRFDEGSNQSKRARKSMSMSIVSIEEGSVNENVPSDGNEGEDREHDAGDDDVRSQALGQIDIVLVTWWEKGCEYAVMLFALARWDSKKRFGLGVLILTLTFGDDCPTET